MDAQRASGPITRGSELPHAEHELRSSIEKSKARMRAAEKNRERVRERERTRERDIEICRRKRGQVKRRKK